jgi:hypothetical protein
MLRRSNPFPCRPISQTSPHVFLAFLRKKRGHAVLCFLSQNFFDHPGAIRAGGILKKEGAAVYVYLIFCQIF